MENASISRYISNISADHTFEIKPKSDIANLGHNYFI